MAWNRSFEAHKIERPEETAIAGRYFVKTTIVVKNYGTSPAADVGLFGLNASEQADKFYAENGPKFGLMNPIQKWRKGTALPDPVTRPKWSCSNAVPKASQTLLRLEIFWTEKVFIRKRGSVTETCLDIRGSLEAGGHTTSRMTAFPRNSFAWVIIEYRNRQLNRIGRRLIMTQVRNKTTRRYIPFLQFRGSAEHFLEKSRLNGTGYWHDRLASVLFSALCLEAVGNCFGAAFKLKFGSI